MQLIFFFVTALQGIAAGVDLENAQPAIPSPPPVLKYIEEDDDIVTVFNQSHEHDFG